MTKFQKALILIFLILGILTWFVVEISSILLPFILAFVLAYFLHPLAIYLDKKNFSISAASIFITFVLCFFIVAVFVIFVPILQAQILALMVKVPQFVDVLWLKIQTLILYTKSERREDQKMQNIIWDLGRFSFFSRRSCASHTPSEFNFTSFRSG